MYRDNVYILYIYAECDVFKYIYIYYFRILYIYIYVYYIIYIERESPPQSPQRHHRLHLMGFQEHTKHADKRVLTKEITERTLWAQHPMNWWKETMKKLKHQPRVRI